MLKGAFKILKFSVLLLKLFMYLKLRDNNRINERCLHFQSRTWRCRQ